MWRPERLRDVIRVGRERVERWRPGAQGLVLCAQHLIEASEEEPTPNALQAALQGLFGGETVGAADVVLESTWLPLMLFDDGGGLWSNAKLEALLRHRLGDLYGQAQASVDGWELRMEYIPGVAKVMGYGLAPGVKRAVIDAAAASGQKLASMQPGFQWGARRHKRQDGWWMWLEQDRALLARIDRGQVAALNAAAPLPRDEEDSARLARIEARRLGEADFAAVVVTSGWNVPWQRVLE